MRFYIIVTINSLFVIKGSAFSDAMRKMNPPTHVATMKRGITAAGRKTRDALNAKKMYEEVSSAFKSLSFMNAKTNEASLKLDILL